MTTDASGFGTTLHIVASQTYPAGVTIKRFSDDSDALDFPSMDIKGTGMGVNGDMVTWSMATPVKKTISVIAGSADDKTLATLFETNRVARGKKSVQDIITATIIYPDGTSWTGIQGVITTGVPGRGIASTGKQKTRSYGFAFENQITTD